jgi:isocitrate dehydrogenase (NAD+)
MTRTLTLLPGDGIGPEVTSATVRVLEAAGARFEWESHVAGAEAVERSGEPLPAAVLESIRRNKVCLKGPVTTPVGKGFRSINVQLRQELRLYANLRPARSVPGLPSKFQDVDLVVVRENTEGLYSGLEHVVVEGVVESLRIITRKASRAIARFAFEYAVRKGRRRVTAVHKANIMKLADGLFLDCCREIAADFPSIEFDDRIIDNMCMQLVVRPETFDVLVLPNFYGDVVSDLAAGLVGGLGVTPGANLGANAAVFEAVHGSAPDIAGQGLANPTALLLSGALMCDHIGQSQVGDRVRAAVAATFERGIRTRDLGGEASTAEFTAALISDLD